MPDRCKNVLKNGLYKILKINILPFALKKLCFCILKAMLFEGESYAFGMQKMLFGKIICPSCMTYPCI